MWSTLSKVIAFLCYLLYDEELLILDGCYHYLVFMNPVNGYLMSRLPIKMQVSLKSKIRFSNASFF